MSRAWQFASTRVAASGPRASARGPALRRALATVFVFLAYAAPLVAVGLAYGMLPRLVPFRGEVHVADLAALEARLFSVPTVAGARPLSEVIARHTSAVLDVVCGATYVVFLLEVLVVAIVLFFRARPKMLELTLGFFAVNVAGWVIWFVYPAAPPWYVDAFGTGPVVLGAASSAAGLARLDALLHVPIAGTFYAKSANVFGAMPSLHVAYATLVACVVWPLGGRLAAFAWAFAGSMAFSAMYLRHHYLLDVLAGVLLALVMARLLRVVFDSSGRPTTAPREAASEPPQSQPSQSQPLPVLAGASLGGGQLAPRRFEHGGDR